MSAIVFESYAVDPTTPPGMLSMGDSKGVPPSTMTFTSPSHPNDPPNYSQVEEDKDYQRFPPAPSPVQELEASNRDSAKYILSPPEEFATFETFTSEREAVMEQETTNEVGQRMSNSFPEIVKEIPLVELHASDV